MKTVVIYTSQTGFTKKYAEWIAAELQADLLAYKEAKKKSADFFTGYDAVIYGGWNMAGRVTNIDWFMNVAGDLKNKRVAVFGVGATPAEDPEIEKLLQNMIPADKKSYIRGFYCEGGLDYSKMGFFSRTMLKMMASSLSKKENLSDYEKRKASVLASSFDATDKKYISEIIEYIRA